MKNMKFARTFLTLALVLVVLGSVIGGTIAWFTDEVTSTNNIIKSGTLDLEVFVGDEGTAIDEYENLEDLSAPLFDYDLWEPGYVSAKSLVIKNVGSLAFKYQLNVKPSVTNDESSEYNLADVIDVYVFDGDTTIDRATVAAATPIGTISDLLGAEGGAFAGVLLPAEGVGSTDVNVAEPTDTPRGEVAIKLVLKMQEEAGNEYQNLSIGDGFALDFVATQYTWENDSFDHTYDEGADFTDPNLPKANVTKLSPEETAEIVAEAFGDGSERYLDVAYHFQTTQTYNEALLNPYANWHADYVVYVDKDITGQVGIAGQYGSFPYWAFDAAYAEGGIVKADSPIRLLRDAGAAMNGTPIYMSYAELCNYVQDFYCGAYDMDGTATGTTLTVELRLYETKPIEESENNSANEETSNYVVINTQRYTF